MTPVVGNRRQYRQRRRLSPLRLRLPLHFLSFCVSALVLFAFTTLLQPSVASAKDTSSPLVFQEDDDSATGRDEPVQLVRPTATGELELVPAGVELLKSFGGVHHPVAVVGPFHSGKSFLLNKLMGRTKGFDTGATVNPTTQGIYMWGRPLSDTERSVILFDTEGLAAPGNTADYDAKIFAIATLLSNHLLYNSVRIIDESSMEYLEVLARRARLFNVNVTSTDGNTKATRLRQFPALTWVVQNFFQQQVDGETPDEWLSRLMDQQAESKTGEFKYTGLRDIFPRRFCRTMFMPASLDQLFDLDRVHATDLDARYRDDLENLVKHLSDVLRENEKAADSVSATALTLSKGKSDSDRHSSRALAAATCDVSLAGGADEPQGHNCDSAVTPNTPRSGAELAHYLTVIVGAINTGRLADVPSLWELYLKQHIGQAREQALTTFRQDMHMGFGKDHGGGGASSVTVGGIGPHPPSESAFAKLLTTTYKRCLALFSELLFDLASESVKLHRRQLELALDQLQDYASEAYHRRVHDYLSTFREKSTQAMAAFVQDLALPQPSAALQQALDAKVAQLTRSMVDMRAEFPTKIAEAEGFLGENLQNYASSVSRKNDRALKDVLEAARAAAVERYETVFREEMTQRADKAYTAAELETANTKAKVPAVATWTQRGKVAHNERVFKGEEALFLQQVSESFADKLRQNEARVEKLLNDAMAKAFDKAKAKLHGTLSSLPLDDAVLAKRQRSMREIAQTAFKEEGQRYSVFAVYGQLLARTLKKVETVLYGKLESENLRALTEKVEQPLARAFRRAADIRSQYWFTSSFLDHARRIAYEEIGDHLSAQHRSRVVDTWLTSNEPRTAGSLVNKGCFPGSSTVEKADGTRVTLDRLQIGDSVRVGVNEFSPVYFFAHQEDVSRG